MQYSSTSNFAEEACCIYMLSNDAVSIISSQKIK